MVVLDRFSRWFVAATLAGGAACASAPEAPAEPTWADVAPIVNGQCNGCHGSTAAQTGGGYRLDLYDMIRDVCGDAAQALRPGTILAGAAAPAIGADVAPLDGSGRARMPPLPASPLADWQRETLQRWSARPIKGAPPAGNAPPSIEVHQLPSTASATLGFSAIVSDPDGDAVVGVIEIADVLFLMDRAGSFAVALDSSTWPAGTHRLTAVLCDGWTAVTVDLGPVQITR